MNDKLSVSLPRDDLRFIDDYLESHTALRSRSAVLHEAITLLKHQGLSAQYDAAFAEREGTEDAALWDSTTSDGIV